jgi:ubiquinone/menaquinone biosynthesis C-methylase UbiE
MVEELDGKKKYFQDYFSEKKAVEKWEDIYKKDDIRGVSVKRRMKQTLSWFDEMQYARDARILDAGCGAGLLTREVLSRGYAVDAMDYSAGMLEKTRSLCDGDRRQDLRLAQADIEAVPFKDSTFDVVFCLGVVSYVRSIEKSLQEISRILKPDGRLIFTTLNKVSLVGYLDVPLTIKSLFRRVFRKKKKREKSGAGQSSASKRFYFTPSVLNALKRFGFTDVKYITVPYRLLTFGGKEIPPRRLNMKATLLLERIPRFPVIGPLGGHCLFIAKKKEGVDGGESKRTK